MNNDVDNFGNFDLNNGKYELIGAIIHLGTSILCGHYICYIRRNNEWLYCNDNKIAVV
jgi:ubiquitin carboxyl-terminal hydrolase 5/13